MGTLVWDFDGTLASREGKWTGTLVEVARRGGMEIDPERIRPWLKSGFPWHTPERPHPELRTAAEWWDALDPVCERAFVGAGVSDSQAHELAALVRRVYPDLAYWRLYDDTLPTLDRLAADGWTHVVLSNHVPELRAIVDRLGLRQFVAHLFNSAETGYEKPHPRALGMVIESVGGSEPMWVIGDSMRADVAAADAAGIPAVLVRTCDPHARRRCDDLSGVPDIVGEPTGGRS